VELSHETIANASLGFIQSTILLKLRIIRDESKNIINNLDLVMR
jgi:hypothetical protein